MDSPPDLQRQRRSGVMSKVVDSAVLLAAATGFLFIFGLLYSRYYLYTLSFPYQFIDASTTFFIMRSTTPIFISVSYMVSLSSYIWLSSWMNFIFEKTYKISEYSTQVAAFIQTAVYVLFVAIPLSIGISMIYIWGYGYVISDNTVSLVIFLSILFFLSMIKSFVLTEIRGKIENGYIVPNILNRIVVVSSAVIFISIIVFSSYSAITFGRTEAEKLIEGKSRNSLEISFTTKDNSLKPSEHFILVMIYDDDYYVTKMASPAPSKPTLLVIPKDDVKNFTIQRLNS